MEYIVSKEAAKILGVHPNTLRKWAQTGEIKNVGSAKWIKLIDGSRVCRDISGARNVLIKWLSTYFVLGDPPVQKHAVNES